MRRVLIVIAAALWLLCLPAAADTPDTEGWIGGILSWREANGGLLSPDQAGATPFDWYAFDAGRMGLSGTGEYRAALEEAAAGESRLATDDHRRGLALAALGGDPQAAGLIARGITGREGLGQQGAGAYIWGLILLDARQTPLPADSLYTREELVAALLTYQTEVGGFSLEGRIPDADITAMALCALYPYAENCREATDRAWQWLSDTQLDTGGFQSWGSAYAESAAQVLIALCTWGRDPLTDPAFIKNGRTVLDALAAYRRDDGSFAHTPEGEANLMAGEQVLRACIAYRRFLAGEKRLYDLTPDPVPTVTAPIATAAPSEKQPRGTSSLWWILPAAVLLTGGIGVWRWRKR